VHVDEAEDEPPVLPERYKMDLTAFWVNIGGVSVAK